MVGIGDVEDHVKRGEEHWVLSYSRFDRTWTAMELSTAREANGESAVAAFAAAIEQPPEQLPTWAQEMADSLEEQLRDVERHPCPCCGFLTLFGRGNWASCPVCRWEDEPHLDDDPDRHSALNGLTLGEARANYAACGSAFPKKRLRLRPPLPDEIPR